LKQQQKEGIIYEVPLDLIDLEEYERESTLKAAAHPKQQIQASKDPRRPMTIMKRINNYLSEQIL